MAQCFQRLCSIFMSCCTKSFPSTTLGFLFLFFSFALLSTHPRNLFSTPCFVTVLTHHAYPPSPTYSHNLSLSLSTRSGTLTVLDARSLRFIARARPSGDRTGSAVREIRFANAPILADCGDDQNDDDGYDSIGGADGKEDRNEYSSSSAQSGNGGESLMLVNSADRIVRLVDANTCVLCVVCAVMVLFCV